MLLEVMNKDDILDEIRRTAEVNGGIPLGVARFQAETGVSPENVGKSRSTGRQAAWGHTADGRYIIAIYRMLDDITVQPVTAYEV